MEAIKEGVALMERGEHDAALRKLATVIAVAPRNPHAINSVGNVYLAQGKPHEALAAFDAALDEVRGLAPPHYNRALALHSLGRAHEAVSAYRQAIEIDANFASAYSGLGAVLMELGQFEEADQSYESALACAPRDVRTLHRALDARRVATGNPHLRTVDQLLERVDDLPVNDQIELHFAKAKSEADLGNNEVAFDHYLLGNAKKRSQFVYDEVRERRFFDDTQEVFNTQFLLKRLGEGNPQSVPIFIVGMPRSGTTLIEQILASHPHVTPGGERSDIHHVAYEASLHFRCDYPHWLHRMEAVDFTTLSQRYLDRLGPLATANQHFTDKMPGNVLYLGLIALMFPNARIINVRRNALDTCISCFTNLFSETQPFAYDLTELGRYYRMYDRLATHWKTVLPPETYLEIHYEELVADLETQARRLLGHVQLPWDPAVLEFHRTKRTVRTASLTQVRQPLYASSVGRANRYLDRLGPLLSALEGDSSSE